MMTDGLKVFGGAGLKVLLRDWTSTPLRGVASGALVTAVVQSSSAVTVATIGFVNAGILSLHQAIGVVFGTNVGTTMTGWLVSLVGVGFRIEALALPILAVGVALSLLSRGKRLQGLGRALAGFGLFFLGLGILKEAFSGVADAFDEDMVSGAAGIAGLLGFLAAGLAATVLTQSSSAAIALILTASAHGVIGLDGAAAAIIGANIGTTSTALLAVIGATPNAKRVAVAHLAFNVVTGAVALAILPVAIAGLAYAGTWLAGGGQAAPLLALFHTLFNVLGVMLMLPLARPLSRWLERLFHSQEEDIAKPHYLDRTVLATPTLALAALRSELVRLSGLVRELALGAMKGIYPPQVGAARRAEAALALARTVEEFATSIRMESLAQAVAEDLPRGLRIARYLEEAAGLVTETETLRREGLNLGDGAARTAVQAVLEAAERTVDRLAAAEPVADTAAPLPPAFEAFQASYQVAKSALLRAAAAGELGVEQVDPVLDALSRARRMVEQLVKADHLLSTRPETADASFSTTREPSLAG